MKEIEKYFKIKKKQEIVFKSFKKTLNVEKIFLKNL